MVMPAYVFCPSAACVYWISLVVTQAPAASAACASVFAAPCSPFCCQIHPGSCNCAEGVDSGCQTPQLLISSASHACA